MNINFTAFLTLLPLLCMSNPFSMQMTFGQLGKLRDDMGPNGFANKMEAIKRHLIEGLEHQNDKKSTPQIVQVIRTRERMVVDQNNKPVDYAANVKRSMYQVLPNELGSPTRIRRIMRSTMKIIPKEHSKMVENMDADKFIGMSREDIKKFRHRMEALSSGHSASGDEIPTPDEKKARRRRIVRSLLLGFSAAATLYGIAFVVLYAISLIIEKSTSSSENDMEDGKNEKLIIAATEALKKDRSDAKDIDQLIE